MIKKLEGKQNPKIAKKISRYLIEDKFTYEQYHEEGEEFKKIHSGFLKFIDENISVDSIKKMLIILNVSIDDCFLIDLIEEFKKITEVEKMIDLFVLNYRNKKYGDHTLLLFKLVLNKWLFDNGYSLLIIYPSFTKELNNLLSYGGDLAVMKRLVINFYNDSYVRNTIFKIKTRNEMLEEIKKRQDTLTQQFGITKLSMFGSYSKNTQTEFSDLDLYVESKEKFTVFEKFAIDDYLSTLLKVKVNIVTKCDFVHYEMIEVF